MYFKSKKDMLYTLLIWGTILFMLAMMIKEEEKGIGLVVGVAIVALFGWLWFCTGYTIEEGTILIRSGPLRAEVPIQEIRKLRKTKNPISAAALSMDRIEISYGKFYDVTYISPVDERAFVQLLLEQNPNIELEDQMRDWFEE